MIRNEQLYYEGLPDSTRWGYDVGDGCHRICGRGNNELQYYTENRPADARVEARGKLPGGRGTWPAIWMPPTGRAYSGWPASGDIDILEHVGYQPDSIFGSIHTQACNYRQGAQRTKGIFAPVAEDSFHLYAIEWDEKKIVFFLDGTKYLTFEDEGTGFEAWPFGQAFYLILNIAVGGDWGGKYGIDDSIWPRRMEIDYISVFQSTKQVNKT